MLLPLRYLNVFVSINLVTINEFSMMEPSERSLDIKLRIVREKFNMDSARAVL